MCVSGMSAAGGGVNIVLGNTSSVPVWSRITVGRRSPTLLVARFRRFHRFRIIAIMVFRLKGHFSDLETETAW